MSWKNKISEAFGSADKGFSSHSVETKRALDLLNSAIESEVGFSEYLREIESWMRSQGCCEEHISAEMEKVKDLESYFGND